MLFAPALKKHKKTTLVNDTIFTISPNFIHYFIIKSPSQSLVITNMRHLSKTTEPAFSGVEIYFFDQVDDPGPREEG